ncbi:hypothetical protein BKA62DRAFT_174198 [Auriculariales sp. MPI-PUGE-AT-0066]|nr:hypothetical protein BKA62DRAFT_174198 [Auriculariales sp. MPI-PUGE-AT-0066]
MPIAASLAKAAFHSFQSGSSGKPHSSITEWIDILTSDNYGEEELDGIPEIVESINLQAEGPTEAARAVRKKIKHGTTHQKYRALVILKALVENGDKKFQSMPYFPRSRDMNSCSLARAASFMDDRLVEAIRGLHSDPSTDVRVKKKLISVLASWHRQFKDDPSMKTIANLYTACKNDNKPDPHIVEGIMLQDQKQLQAQRDAKEAARRKREEDEAARKKAKEDAKRKEREQRERANRPKRPPFNFEKEKPQIITAIATAAQASTNLNNAVKSVNIKETPLETHPRVQECLNSLKTARKPIIRYIQLVENEELIGTLLDTNERIISALQIYDMACHPPTEEPEEQTVAQGKAADGHRGEINKLQHRQRVEIHRAASNSQLSTNKEQYGDLRGLEFGGGGARGLQAPLQPRARHEDSEDDDEGGYQRGTLSDYSDYDSDAAPPRSDSSSQRAGPSSGARRASGTTSRPTKGAGAYDDLLGEEDDLYAEPKRGLLSQEDDPFADPFADSHARR